jgi:NitT/TauT family transport system substrate-binding protein
MNKKIVFFSVTLVLVLGGIFGTRYIMGLAQDEIRISSNPWVGFTPFIYAQEKGWFDRTPFRFVWQVDLTENVRLFERGFTQGFTATQYEMLHAKNPSELVPVFLIDRSDGADSILSNKTINQLSDTTEPIRVYLERDSMQSDLFKAFVREYGLIDRKFVFINSAQKSMTEIKPVVTPEILLSYAPYASQLLEKGFHVIASSHTLKSFSVVDALFVNKHIVDQDRNQFYTLKRIYDRALDSFHQNPKEYYQKIQGYLEGQTYAQFMQSTQEIEWFVGPPRTQILTQLRAQGINTSQLLP